MKPEKPDAPRLGLFLRVAEYLPPAALMLLFLQQCYEHALTHNLISPARKRFIQSRKRERTNATVDQIWLFGHHACVTEAMVHDLCAILRNAEGRRQKPAAAIFDSRTLQSTPESGEEGRAGL